MYGMSGPSRKSAASRKRQSAKPGPGLAGSGFSHAGRANGRGGQEEHVNLKQRCQSDIPVGKNHNA